MSSAAMSTLLDLGFERRAGVAGRDEDLLYARRLRALPGKRVLAAAAADDQNSHAIGRLLVAEVTHPGEHHGDVVFVGRGDDFGIAPRAARLNDGLDAELGKRVEAVAKREERIRSDRPHSSVRSVVLRPSWRRSCC